MIRAVFVGTCCLTVDGHAGQAEKGKDIVCAGVSALVSALAYMLTDLSPDALDITMKPGHAELRCKPSKQAEQAFLQTRYGLMLIMSEYGEYLDVQ